MALSVHPPPPTLLTHSCSFLLLTSAEQINSADPLIYTHGMRINILPYMEYTELSPSQMNAAVPTGEVFNHWVTGSRQKQMLQ